MSSSLWLDFGPKDYGKNTCQYCNIVEQVVFDLWLVEPPLRWLSYLLSRNDLNVDQTHIDYVCMSIAEMVVVCSSLVCPLQVT